MPLRIVTTRQDRSSYWWRFVFYVQLWYALRFEIAPGDAMRITRVPVSIAIHRFGQCSAVTLRIDFCPSDHFERMLHIVREVMLAERIDELFIELRGIMKCSVENYEQWLRSLGYTELGHKDNPSFYVRLY